MTTVCIVHIYACMYAKSHAIPWTVVRQSPLPMRFFSQKYWSGLPCPPPGNIPDPGRYLCLLQLLPYRRILYHLDTREAHTCIYMYVYMHTYMCVYVCIT